MAPRLTGALYTYCAHVLYVGALVAASRHQHHAGQVMWVPAGLDVADEDGQLRRVSTHAVPPDRLHSHGGAAAAAVLWVDGDDLQWDRALKLSHDLSRVLPTALGERLNASLPPPDARAVAQALLDVVATARELQTHAPRHPAVKRMCALLDGTAAEREMRVTELARQSGLSMRQLRHRFTEELGINPRAYLRWRRLRRAISAIEGGATLTEAALQGGFADGAHFCRVFHAQFGMSPSQALSSVRFAGSL